MKRMTGSCRVAAVGLLALVALAACVVGGYEGDVGVGYVGGVYEPGGYVYGGWPAGYRVGPPRGGVGGRGGRAAPSIPHGARGGGGHHGGGPGH
jgi:hypothetical protein